MKYNKIIKLFNLVNQTPIYFASSFIKRDPNLWVFGSWSGQLYNDNSKYLFEYIVESKNNINAVWITKNRKVLKELKSRQQPAYYCYSVRGIYIQLKAGACFFTQSHSLDLLGSATQRALLFQLWHGMPLKKILNDDNSLRTNKNNKLRLLINKAFPWTKDEWDVVISPSKDAERIIRSAFGDEVIIINSGFPRNKRLCIPSLNTPNAKIKKVIYMPTFRGIPSTISSNEYIQQYLIDNGFEINKINKLCYENKINFYIKLHPVNDVTDDFRHQINTSSNVHLLDNNFDFYEDAQDFDLLITDYSSIFFDFSLTKKPILHVAFDVNDYISNSRELYFKYEDIRVGKKLSNWLEVIEYISSVENIEELIHSENYQNILKLMCADTDNPSNHIYQEAVKLLQLRN